MSIRQLAKDWPLVGREEEVAVFSDAWSKQWCRGVLIYGPAGVGKSHLATNYLKLANRNLGHGITVTATEQAAAVPLGAMSHLLPADIDMSDPVRVFSTVARALTGPGGHPRPLMVDDLHLIDDTSAVLLKQLVDVDAIRLIATIRSEQHRDVLDLFARDSSILRIDLEPLDRERVLKLLQIVLGETVTWQTVDALFAVSRGNLLYLRELILGAVSTGALKKEDEVWQLEDDGVVGTPLLTELVQIRLNAAPQAAKTILQLLSFCEPLPLRHAEEVTQHDTLIELEDSGLVHVMRDGRRASLSLAHPLYGEVLRSTTPKETSRALLLQEIGRIENHGSRRRHDVVNIASWRLTATGTESPELLLRAANLARHAHDYQQVLTLLEAITAENHSFQTQLLMGEALMETGKAVQAEEFLAQVNAQAVNEEEKLALVHLRTMNMGFGAGKMEEAFKLNDIARTEICAAQNVQMLDVNEGINRAFSGEPAHALSLLENLPYNCENAPEPNMWLMGALMKTYSLALQGRTKDAITWARHAHETHVRLNDHVIVPHPSDQHNPLIVAFTNAGRLADARSLFDRTNFDLLEARAPLPRIWANVYAGRNEWIAGHPSTALRWYSEARNMAKKYNHTLPVPLIEAAMKACNAQLGRFTAAAENPVYPRLHLGAEIALGDAWIFALAGKKDVAVRILQDAAHQARLTSHAPSEAIILTDIARIGDARGVLDRLRQVCEASDGNLVPLQLEFVKAIVGREPEKLLSCSEKLGAAGLDLLAAEASNSAAALWNRIGQQRLATAAAQRAHVYASRCEGASTLLLPKSSTQRVQQLSDRELEVGRLAAKGSSSKEIAEVLHLSVRTVDNHLQRIYAKLGVTNRRALVEALRG
ncbi:LuxR C-terminal-related transcriptional regulator [Streptomyces sp. NPDC086783]|uniref:LuxR C-terminal-related transcriptional regulator n=1 Tax=Streptomyces sp. NPDC086783 TaxID=3365758 RepID=UPI0037FA5CE3